MTLIDARYFYLENEELVESREVEKEEELEERTENKHWIQFLSGGNGLFIHWFSYQLQQYKRFHYQGITRHYSLVRKSVLGLFIKHCCLKIPLR